ncbi:MAG TPA: hypothetical protein VMG14_08280 [Thermoplasmata archaeon]|nr:hypothetical protein [Thermoplasmata archaeon]
MTDEELRIRDLSRRPRAEWEPPIGALGGPPAHELYHDLVVHAGLRLLRDLDGRPWIEIQDGERRRAFEVPGPDLRGALDRFRMRRNLRPVPESDVEEFVRVVEARASDPDVIFPERDAPARPRAEVVTPDPAEATSLEPFPATSAPEGWAVERLDRLMEEVDEIQGRASPAPAEDPKTPPWWTQYGHPVPLHSRLPHRWHASVSGGRQEAPAADGDLSRYLRALHDLVRDGAWIGPLHEIGRRTGDPPDAVFAALLKYHADLVTEGLVVAPVELEEGWRWMIVDRSRIPPSPEPVRPS